MLGTWPHAHITVLSRSRPNLPRVVNLVANLVVRDVGSDQFSGSPLHVAREFVVRLQAIAHRLPGDRHISLFLEGGFARKLPFRSLTETFVIPVAEHPECFRQSSVGNETPLHRVPTIHQLHDVQPRHGHAFVKWCVHALVPIG